MSRSRRRGGGGGSRRGGGGGGGKLGGTFGPGTFLPIVPAKPTEPTKPAEPAKSTKPAEPTKSSEPAKTAESAEPDLPDFPLWPPPAPSASYVLPDKLLEGRPTLKDATDAIISALESTGYVERSFYRTKPGGIALVTRLERIESDGSPANPERWATGDGTHPGTADIVNFLRGLFFVTEGHYRLIVFVIQANPFIPSTARIDEPQARALISHGANVLPAETAKRSFDGNYCTALIYEFSSSGKAVSFLAQSPLTGRQHLEKAGVLSLLGKPK